MKQWFVTFTLGHGWDLVTTVSAENADAAIRIARADLFAKRPDYISYRFESVDAEEFA
jgi:hypothetical protein